MERKQHSDVFYRGFFACDRCPVRLPTSVFVARDKNFIKFESAKHAQLTEARNATKLRRLRSYALSSCCGLEARARNGRVLGLNSVAETLAARKAA